MAFSLPPSLTQSQKLFKRRITSAIAQGQAEDVLATMNDVACLPWTVNRAMVCGVAKLNHPKALKSVVMACDPRVVRAALRTLFIQEDEPSMLAVAEHLGKEGIEVLMQATSASDRVDFMTRLIERFGRREDFKFMLVQALPAAAKQRQWPLLRHLVQVAEVPAQVIEQQAGACLHLMVGCPTAPVDLVEHLLTIKQSKGDRLWGDLLIRAAEEGCTTFLDLLVASNKVKPDVLTEAAVEAVVGKRDDVAAFLVPRVSLNDLAQMFQAQISDAQWGKDGAERLHSLRQGADQVARLLKADDLEKWAAKFPKEPMLLTQARLRELRTLAREDEGLPPLDEIRKTRVRP